MVNSKINNILSSLFLEEKNILIVDSIVIILCAIDISKNCFFNNQQVKFYVKTRKKTEHLPRMIFSEISFSFKIAGRFRLSLLS